jgi:hypothetical protein
LPDILVLGAHALISLPEHGIATRDRWSIAGAETGAQTVIQVMELYGPMGMINRVALLTILCHFCFGTPQIKL